MLKAGWAGKGQGTQLTGWEWLVVIRAEKYLLSPYPHPQSSTCVQNPFVAFGYNNMQIDEFGVT